MLLLGIVAFSHNYLAQAGAIDEAVRRGVLKVGTDPSYVPFEMTDKRGRIVGFEIDLLEEMSKALGVRLELVPVVYTDLIAQLLDNRFDMIGSGMTVTQARNLKINFSDSFIIVGQTVLFHPRLAGQIASVEDLNDAGYQIVATDGTTGEAAAKRILGRARLRSFATPEEGVRQVVAGKADAFVHDAPYNLIAITRPENRKLLALEQPFTYESLAFGLKKGDHDSINFINHFLDQIGNDGTYDRIHDKWFNSSDWLKDLP